MRHTELLGVERHSSTRSRLYHSSTRSRLYETYSLVQANYHLLPLFLSVLIRTICARQSLKLLRKYHFPSKPVVRTAYNFQYIRQDLNAWIQQLNTLFLHMTPFSGFSACSSIQRCKGINNCIVYFQYISSTVIVHG